jgi:hypothetical protein
MGVVVSMAGFRVLVDIKMFEEETVNVTPATIPAKLDIGMTLCPRTTLSNVIIGRGCIMSAAVTVNLSQATDPKLRPLTHIPQLVLMIKAVVTPATTMGIMLSITTRSTGGMSESLRPSRGKFLKSQLIYNLKSTEYSGVNQFNSRFMLVYWFL